jgi:nicotinamidase-related amidase
MVMAKTRKDLFGSAPDKSPVALILIDVINELNFPEASALLRHAVPMAKRLAGLKERAIEHGAAVIYVNDNFGRWRSDFKSQVRHCLKDGVKGKPLAELLRPRPSDYFVLKPVHSGFYSTALEVLLKHLEAKTLIVTGMATNICVQFTANDAYLRGYKLVVPCDCVAANTAALSRNALKEMQATLKASIPKATSLKWRELLNAQASA